MDIFEGTNCTSNEYGSVKIVTNKLRVDITTYRRDLRYNGDRRKVEIEYVDNLIDDLKRRDFTMNTMCIDANGNLEIVPDEAAVVCAIYEWRNEGASLREIVRRLMDKGIPAPRGGKTWHIEAIRRILTNEKYYGDVCLQKTYIADYFTGKQVPNRGERDCYLLRDHHTAIIPKCK